jgi:hypothetical protein
VDRGTDIGRRTRGPAGRTARRRDRCVRTWAGLAIALLLMLGAPRVRAEDDSTVAEYRIKAAFLLKFLDFVTWPPLAADRADGPVVIGVLGASGLGDALQQVAAGRPVNGRPVQVRVLRDDESPNGLQMLFVGRAANGRVATIAAATERQPMLLVTESDAGLAPGGAINFVVVDDKVRFDIALRPAERAGLKISARMLAVARGVLPGSP